MCFLGEDHFTNVLANVVKTISSSIQAILWNGSIELRAEMVGVCDEGLEDLRPTLH
jgi:hypothetical protein